jgi:hypothetical protein
MLPGIEEGLEKDSRREEGLERGSLDSEEAGIQDTDHKKMTWSPLVIFF